MLSPTKKIKMLDALKLYKKKYLDKVNNTELDEASTRIFINTFLSEVLGFSLIDEIKTEFMIRGTYADYMIQVDGHRHFLVEVKAYPLDLSEKHLRQTLNYGANEGIEYALLTNGHSFELHKILFTQPINSCLIFTVELTDLPSLKKAAELLQFIHKDSVLKGGLDTLWDKCEALNKFTVAGMLLSAEVIGTVKSLIKRKYDQRCSDDEVAAVIQQIIKDEIEPEAVKIYKKAKPERLKKPTKVENTIMAAKEGIEKIEEIQPASEN
jgi:hypothetical protein